MNVKFNELCYLTGLFTQITYGKLLNIQRHLGVKIKYS